MQYFSKEYIDFFKDLSNNNTKEWFPINLDAKKCISRINRDIRFAKECSYY